MRIVPCIDIVCRILARARVPYTHLYINMYVTAAVLIIMTLSFEGYDVHNNNNNNNTNYCGV